jgi:hypothetical protein
LFFPILSKFLTSTSIAGPYPPSTCDSILNHPLSSARAYKEAWDEPDVLSTIEKESGRQFDPELVEIFFSRLNILRAIQERYKA